MLDFTQILDGTPPNTGAAITVTRVSTNTLDLLVARDVGAAEPLGVHCQVLTAFTAAGAATMRIDLEVSADNVTFFSILESPLVPVAQLIIGCPIFRYAVPVNQVLNATAGVLKAPGRYLRLNYTIATGPMLTGTIFSYITPRLDRGAFYAYPANYTAYVAAGEL